MTPAKTMTKTCSMCRKTKPLDSFFKRKENKVDGRKSYCKPCNKVYDATKREENINVFKARCTDWKSRNKDYRRAYDTFHKGKTKSLIPSFLKDCPVEEKRVKDIYKLKGLMSLVTGVPHQVDHMWPLSDGGPHWSGNMQILTATENRRKWATVDPEVKANIQKSLEEERLRHEH